jgi:PAS domain S-box-containing protein
MINKNKVIEKQWQQFVENKELQNRQIREVIYNSWQRCKEFNVDPYNGRGERRDGNFLKRLRNANQVLIEIAEPFMRELAKIVKESNFVVVLTDKQGMIMETAGEGEIYKEAEKLNFLPGANWSEEQVGTNAIGTVLKIDKTLQVVGSEHYCKKHHPWTCSAAPIHDQNGKIIGVLNMSGYYKNAHLHTLGMVDAAAKSIENQFSLAAKNKELKKAHKFSTAVLNSMSEGLISINKYGSIILINQAASRMLGINRKEAVGRDIKRVLGEQKNIEKMLTNHKIFNDEEIAIHKNQEKIYFNISTRMLLSNSGIPDGFIIVLRKMKAVKKMVNRLAGSEARFEFKDIIGDHPDIKEVIELGKMISDSQAAVLIEGESGTGKEMMAQAIHNCCRRANQVFLSINCAAIPQSLLESELFGYEGGSFTGANQKGRPGKFELASGGTLLLDEIGEMPLNMQASLLRVLQEKEINRIGGIEPINVDVRVLASTNKKLEEEVKKGNFRKDLFFRLNTVTIEMPPLRNRVTDIEKLVKHFIAVLNQRSDKRIYSVEDKVFDLLKNYSWPGNVRELQNVIERAVLLSKNGVIKVENLTAELKNNCVKDQKIKKVESLNFPLVELEELEIIMLKKCLDQSRTITEAAKKLGVSRSTFYRKANKYNIGL